LIAASAVFLALVSVPLSGQAAQDPTQSTATAPSQPRPVTVFKTTVQRVVVDVVVTDPKGHPVTGLNKSDFTVFEDGKPQPVRSFEMHTAKVDDTYVPPKIPKLPPNTFLNLQTAPQSGTPTVILYDVLNTPSDALPYAHQEIVKFLKHRKPGTQVAIFVLGDKLHLLQGFTDNTEVLTAALDQKKGIPAQSSLVDSAPSTLTNSDAIGHTPPSVLPTNPSTSAQSTTPLVDPAILSSLANFEAIEQSFLLDRRVDITLDSLTEIGRFLAGLPGRKNLIWLSGSFPSGVLPDPTIDVNSLSADQSTRSYSAEIKQATDLLNLSHVAVYPVDARGLQVPPQYSASKGGAPGINSMPQFTSSQAEEHSTMDSIADDTGGHAFYNTNDLQEAVSNAMNNGSTYYSISYAPTNPNFDGSLRKIKVKLQQAGYTLSYRRTYFADDLNAAAEAVQDAPQSPLTLSLEHGTPLSHELFVEAHLDTVGAPVAATPHQMELLAQYEAMRTKKKKKNAPPTQLPPVMMQQYLIEYGLIARQLDLQPGPSGSQKASLELGVISYDDDGRKLNGIDTRIDETIPAERYTVIKNEGYHLVQSVIIPVTASSVRLAVRDTKDNRIGSLEVQLPLAKTPGTTPTP
jgi:VWFA-related protein